MKGKFFTTITPYLDWIDSGKIFKKPVSWLYSFIALTFILFPFYIIYWAIEFDIFGYPFKFGLVYIILLILYTILSWLSFQIWWNRMNDISELTNAGADFTATFIFSHLLQTSGETLAIWFGLGGAVFSIIMVVFFGEDLNVFYNLLPLSEGSIEFVFINLIVGFSLLIFTRFMAEQFRALATIANNTSK